MSRETITGRFCYFDLAAAGIAVLVTGGLLYGPIARGAWNFSDVIKILMFVVACVVFAAFRWRAYKQNITWLIASFAAFLGIAMVSAFWQLPLMWFMVAMSIGATLLLLGLVAPAKPLREPVRRLEVFKLVTLVGTLVFIVAGTEGMLRLMPGVFSKETQQLLTSTPSNSGVGHPYIGHLHRPDRTFEFAGRDFGARHSVDAFGFRNRWPWPERSDIVAVGDSLTFGLGVEDNHAWPTVVRGAVGKEVISLGLVGAGPQQYLRLYETFGVKLHPKLLLVGVYAQNDFWDAGQFDQWLREGVGDNYMVWRNFGRPLRYQFTLRHPIATAEGFFRAHVYQVIRSSHLYNLLRALRGGDAQEMTDVKIIDFPDGGRVQLTPQGFRTMSAGAQANTREFNLAFDALQRLHELATQQGTKVLMVLQPSKEEVYLPLAGEPMVDPTVALRQAFDTVGISYLDLGPDFRQRAEAGERLFFEVDTHPNEAGYALIGELVASHVKRNASRYGL